jgi:uncharacterized repeat protein (TIGR03843 family)
VKDDPSIYDIIRHGKFESCRLIAAGSNYTFLAEVRLDDRCIPVIYKPRDGESPLWDFPSGTLYKREYAAYLLSQVLGWDLIPFTVIREGPHGIGTVQRYVEHDPRQNYYTLSAENSEEYAGQLRNIACFDLVANSTDRKANHLIVDPNGKLWSIDHGLTFHADTKIRTVIWDFCGEPIPESLLAQLATLAKQLLNPQDRLEEMLALLRPEEAASLQQRLVWVLTERVYPGLPGRHRRRG